MTFRRALGLNIRRTRRAADVTQEALAQKTRIPRTAISGYERGHRTPSLETFVKLADALEVTPLELLPGPEWKLKDRS